ncbi:MAG: acyltransferase [Pseudorhodoferax sp.]
MRKISIDTLRGLACILLVGYHVAGGDPSSGLRLSDDHPITDLNEVLSIIRMPLFSFLSGFVYAWRPYDGDSLRFFKGKARRLLMPMLLVGTIFAMIQARMPGTNNQVENWFLLHIIPVAHYWFLESLFIIFLVTALLEHYRLMSTPKRSALVFFCASLLFVWAPLPHHLGLGGASYLFPFFLLGINANRFRDELEKALPWVVALFVLVSAYLVFFDGEVPQRNDELSLLVSATACIIVLSLKLEWPLVAAVGAESFVIFLFHSMFSSASRIALSAFGVKSVLVALPVGILVGLVGPILVGKVLRKLPLGHWFIGEPRSSGARAAHRAG